MLKDLWENRASILLGLGAGILFTLVVGFKYGGWYTAGQAEKFAQERTEAAQIALLTPACVKSFMAQTDYAAKKTELLATQEYQRDNLLPAELITLPGSTYRNYNVARGCLDGILSDSAQKN